MAIKPKTWIPLNPMADQPAQPVKAQETKPVAKPVIEKPKTQASQPVAGGDQPGKRGRKPSADPKKHVTLRLPASLIRDLDAQHPDWKAQIEPLLRTHFRPNQF